MSIDSLPYMVFLLLVEFTAGGLLVLYAANVRGLVTRGFLKMSAACVVAAGGLALWVGASLGDADDVGGYPLDSRFLTPSVIALAALFVVTLVYAVALFREQSRIERTVGAVACAVGIAGLGLTAGIFQDPAWSYAGVLLSLLAGGLSLGAVTLGMILGHWYLVTPRLPEQPLNEFTVGLIAVLAVQAVLVVVNLIAPVRHVPDAAAAGSHLVQNPAFWLRIGVGLLFPILLAVMAWRSSLERGMMSATGLLYIATGAVLAGEALARGLQFSTAIPF